jgi:predicted acylesterase/phospholipase RssA
MWTPEIMKGYTANLRASQDGSIRFTETSGLVDDDVLNDRIRNILGDRTFKDLAIPLKLVATDLN